MAESDLYSPQECLTYLLENDGWWLWSIYVHREQFRLLNSLWPKLTDEEVDCLCSAIMVGPPRTMFRETTEEDVFRKVSDRSIWSHLAKVRSWGNELPKAASEALRDLSAKNAAWTLAKGDRDEFPIWMEGSFGEPPIENVDVNELLNASDEAVVARLITPGARGSADLRKWQHIVAAQPTRASRLLSAVAEAGHWPHELWESLLKGLSGAKLSAREWPSLLGPF